MLANSSSRRTGTGLQTRISAWSRIGAPRSSGQATSDPYQTSPTLPPWGMVTPTLGMSFRVFHHDVPRTQHRFTRTCLRIFKQIGRFNAPTPCPAGENEREAEIKYSPQKRSSDRLTVE